MATLLLVDGMSWGNRQQAGACSLPSCGCYRSSCEPCSSSTTRCASSNNFLDRVDPPLPRFPDHYTNKRTGMPGPRLVIEMRPTLSSPYRDEPLDTLVEPSSPNYGDTSRQIGISSDGQEVKRYQRVSPPSLSVSQSRRAMASGAVLQVASSSLQAKELKGTTGFYLGFATLVLGLMAALQKGGLLGNGGAPTAVCASCNGYGRRICSLCKGTGSVTWEGKLKHIDVCPSCLGDRIKKCSDCGGYRMRKDVPPFLQQTSRISKS